ncbi:MAG: ABC transporter permease subunit [Nocardioides sp.]|jgi:putative spermidine/putrescine transport system permease protein
MSQLESGATASAVAPDPEPAKRKRGGGFSWGVALALLPFAAFIAFFLIWPTGAVFWRSLFPGGEFGFSSLTRAVTGPYRSAFIASIKLSLTSALLGGALGTLLALSVRDYAARRPRTLALINSWSAVASQLGGVPLAFAFIALIGTQGLLTKVLREGFDINILDTSFTISGFWGLVAVYLYFQIPLMFLVMLPAISGLRRSWHEAAALMGASSLTYWRRVGLPVLTPAFLGGVVLLFVNSFAAYATAYVLDPGANLVPLKVRFVLQGNVISGEQDLGYALVAWTIIVLLVCLVVVNVLQRRTAKWTQS